MKGHNNKSVRVATGSKFTSRPPKKKFLANHPDTKFNAMTRRYE